MTETDFTTDWLSERFRFDSASRNEQIEQTCFSLFPSRKRLQIVDIGAGHGSNFFYLFPKIQQHQEWTFVELNEGLLDAALDRILVYARTQEFPFEREGQTIFFRANQKDIKVTGKHASFLELEKVVSLAEIDLVTAAAVFDLLSVELFEQFAKTLIQARIPLLSTINYLGMAFQPEVEGDALYLKFYNDHMLRQQDFGQSMGPDCMKHMGAFFQKNGVQMEIGSSDWQVGTEDQRMHHFLLGYLEHAIGEILADEQRKRAFELWLARKRKMVEKRGLETVVFHQDFVVYF